MALVTGYHVFGACEELRGDSPGMPLIARLVDMSSRHDSRTFLSHCIDADTPCLVRFETETSTLASLRRESSSHHRDADSVIPSEPPCAEIGYAYCSN